MTVGEQSRLNQTSVSQLGSEAEMKSGLPSFPVSLLVYHQSWLFGLHISVLRLINTAQGAKKLMYFRHRYSYNYSSSSEFLYSSYAN